MLLALLSAGGDQTTLIEGVSLPDLRDQALVDWHQGFGDADGLADFRALFACASNLRQNTWIRLG